MRKQFTKEQISMMLKERFCSSGIYNLSITTFKFNENSVVIIIDSNDNKYLESLRMKTQAFTKMQTNLQDNKLVISGISL